MGHIAHTAVLLMLAQQLGESFYGFRLLPQDFFDSLAGHLSAAMTMCLFGLIMARMYFYNSIDCFVPAEWPDPWEQAAEAYCYMEGAYAVPWEMVNRTASEEWDVKKPQTYYYWLPFILLALAVILKVPDFLWAMYCQQSVRQPAQTLKAVAYLTEGAEAGNEPEEAERLSRLLAEHLMSGKNSQVDFSTGQMFWAYLMSKALRLVASLGSLVYLQHSLGLSSPLFGVIAWTQSEADNDGMASFPTLTFCDVALRQLSQWNVRTVQCVLPINLLLDKIALFLWFWLLGCGLLCFCSAVVWLFRVGLRTQRRRYVKTFVRVLQSYDQRRRRRRRCSVEEPQQLSRAQHKRLVEQQQQLETSLIHKISTVDRVFLLRLIQERLGMASAYVAMEAMTVHHLSSRLAPYADCV